MYALDSRAGRTITACPSFTGSIKSKDLKQMILFIDDYFTGTPSFYDVFLHMRIIVESSFD